MFARAGFSFGDDAMGIEDTRRRPQDYLYRAAASFVRAHALGTLPASCAKELFGDPVTNLIIHRAASSAAVTGTPSWAGALAEAVVDDLIMAIATVSAAAGLIARGMKLDFGRRASIRVPGRILDASDAGQWTAEDHPAVMRVQRMTAGPTLTPHKLVVLTSYTREMAEQSNIEAVSRALISEASALALDKAMFSNVADDGVTPGGLLNGATQVTPVATGGGTAALAADISKLVGALVAANGGRDVVLVMNPTQATSLKLLSGPKFDLPILQSSSVPAGTVIAIEASSFVSAFDAVPQFEVVTAPLFHFEDTSPQNITGGSPSPAVPVRSPFQVDSYALRMVLKAHWAMRVATHVAYISNTSW
jgi:hypothetical protein